MKEPTKAGVGSIIAAGLIAINIFCLQSIFSQAPNKIDEAQRYMLIAFAIAVPGLSMWYLVITTLKRSTVANKLTDFATTIWVVSFLSVIVEVGLSIWRYYHIAAYVFGAFVLLAISTFIMMIAAENKIPK